MSACVSDFSIQLGLSFVLELHNLINFLKQTISYQLFYINLKCVRQRIMFYLYVPLIDLVVRFPNSCIIFAQIISCLYPPTSK